MARLGIEPRPPKYIPGALPIELPSHKYQTWIASFITLCGRLHIQQKKMRMVVTMREWRGMWVEKWQGGSGGGCWI